VSERNRRWRTSLAISGSDRKTQQRRSLVRGRQGQGRYQGSPRKSRPPSSATILQKDKTNPSANSVEAGQLSTFNFTSLHFTSLSPYISRYILDTSACLLDSQTRNPQDVLRKLASSISPGIKGITEPYVD
jgi:hypothetical protein